MRKTERIRVDRGVARADQGEAVSGENHVKAQANLDFSPPTKATFAFGCLLDEIASSQTMQ